jgi:hypothetical protein
MTSVWNAFFYFDFGVHRAEFLRFLKRATINPSIKNVVKMFVFIPRKKKHRRPRHFVAGRSQPLEISRPKRRLRAADGGPPGMPVVRRDERARPLSAS